MEIYATALTLFLIMDPLGNIPIFLSVLNKVPEERRRFIIIRELLLALLLMVLFLFSGGSILHTLGLSTEAVAIGGGLVMMIMAIRMIFPNRGTVMGDDEGDGEPFIVPLAIPLIAGPSILATLILITEKNSQSITKALMALLLAWLVTAVILFFSTKLYKILGNRGLKAIERLMGMILISISVQMLLNGFSSFMR
ncbi:YhgN family NAAT transporter [Psychrobacter sp.]|uniref:YhgN family NAAT transporter n=1 Tax=Psychrobacter sp. TaxID=56811 RepID=UPI0026006F1A|nr:YhgN family NAAT transporter [Psychrobacter sp.]